MPQKGVDNFKVTFGSNPPCINVTFPRVGTMAGETFTFYDYTIAYHFAIQFMQAIHNAWRNHDRIGTPYDGTTSSSATKEKAQQDDRPAR